MDLSPENTHDLRLLLADLRVLVEAYAPQGRGDPWINRVHERTAHIQSLLDAEEETRRLQGQALLETLADRLRFRLSDGNLLVGAYRVGLPEQRDESLVFRLDWGFRGRSYEIEVREVPGFVDGS